MNYTLEIYFQYGCEGCEGSQSEVIQTITFSAYLYHIVQFDENTIT